MIGCQKPQAMEVRSVPEPGDPGEIRQRQTFADEVARRIMLAIGEQSLQPGDVLPSEGRLAERHGVSRGVVRESLRILQASGVVRVTNGQRAVVRPVTSELFRVYLHWSLTTGAVSALDALELRRSIEREGAALAAGRLTAEAAMELRGIVAEMRRSLDHLDRYVELDFNLHTAIASASGNKLIGHLMASAEPVMKDLMRVGVRALMDDPRRIEVMHGLHEATVDAILRHDGDGARDCIIEESHRAVENLRALAPGGARPLLIQRWRLTAAAPPSSWLREEPATLPGRIARQIMASIVSDGLAPNALLPPAAELAATYKVSRGVIREALRVLAALSIVRTTNGRGTAVEPLSPEPLSRFLRWALQMEAISQVEIYELRVGIESECAAMAAERILPDEEAALGRLIPLLRERFGDPAVHGDLDLRLHLAVAAASHNPLMERVVVSFHEVIHDLITGGLGAMRGDPDELMRSSHAHEATAGAVIGHDPEEARRRMESMLRTAIRKLDRAATYSRSGQPGDGSWRG